MGNLKAVQPVVEQSKVVSKVSPEVIEKMKNQVKLLHQGFVVFINEVKASHEDSSHVTVKVTLLSEVNNMSVFGDIELKIAKQAVPRLKQQLSKVS